MSETNNSTLSTLTIATKDGEFKVNPSLWTKICPTFAAMINNGMKESKIQKITFPTFSADCIKQLYDASYNNSTLSIELLEEFIYLADQYQLTNLLHGCIKCILQLPPYQKFFTYDSQFNLDIYNQLINNFLNLTINDDIPIYTDSKIYQNLWQQLKHQLFPYDKTNIFIKSYLASNIVDNSILIDKSKNKNNLIKSFDTTVIDNNVNMDVITNLRLVQLKVLLTDSNLLADADYKDIENFLVYNIKNVDGILIYALNQKIKNDTLQQKQLKINYRTGQWTIHNQNLDIKYKI